MKDIEIARNTKLEKIESIAKKINLNLDYLENYGKYKGKIELNQLIEVNDKKDGKLILVTAINPTPLGEGKTTISIGLADALNKLNKKTILALREPSLGPVFGKKGGATGGGYSQVAPMEEINLHFTGDIHAITSANNLLSAIIDNHIYQGNELKIKTVVWRRCLDLNDRSLRNINIGITEKNNGTRIDHFDISVASEIMAILCLSKDINDLKRRISNIVIGYDVNDNEITVKDLKAEGSLTVLLKDALNPNLVQTLEHTPTLIHGGPFANIAHGCNSIIATKFGLKLADYCITEAGFGADLGAEKFLDIKTRLLPKNPDLVVCVATIKSLKYHGGMELEQINNSSIDYLAKGIKNLIKHITNLKEVFGLNVIVAVNKFSSDTNEELDYLINSMNKLNVQVSLVESYSKGSVGAIDLAKKVIELSCLPNKFKYCYELSDNLKEKINKVAKKIYGATSVEFTEQAIEKLNLYSKQGYDKYPICIAKTPFSLSDDAKNLLCDSPFTLHVNDLILKKGAEFIVVMAGNIFTMPGLPKSPAAEKIDIIDNKIVGLF